MSLNLHPKVVGGTLASALSVIILWAASYWVDVPVEVGAALAVVLSFAGGYLTPAK